MMIMIINNRPCVARTILPLVHTRFLDRFSAPSARMRELRASA